MPSTKHGSSSSNKLAPGDEVAIFFSGHGVAVGASILIPRNVPAVASGETRRLKNESLSLRIRRDLAAYGPKLSLFILDACRDNPFTDGRGRSIGGAKGLVPVQAEQGSFIMFAAGAREMALDRLSDTDDDPNSVYTRKLLPILKQPGLRLPDVARRSASGKCANSRTRSDTDKVRPITMRAQMTYALRGGLSCRKRWRRR